MKSFVRAWGLQWIHSLGQELLLLPSQRVGIESKLLSTEEEGAALICHFPAYGGVLVVLRRLLGPPRSREGPRRDVREGCGLGNECSMSLLELSKVSACLSVILWWDFHSAKALDGRGMSLSPAELLVELGQLFPSC